MPKEDCFSVIKALSDETRWKIVRTLLENEGANVGELVERLQVSQPNVSKHLKILRDTGIVISEKEGTVVRCRVTPDILHGRAMLDLGWCSFRFDSANGQKASDGTAPLDA